MSVETFENISRGIDIPLSSSHPDSMDLLKNHLVANVRLKLKDAQNAGDVVEVLDPQWCREHSEEAGRMHADVIVAAYGPTYALPNKDPIANTQAIEDGSLDLYLMKTNNIVTGTACLVDSMDGRAELGRAASLGKTRNAIIQDLRLVDWLIDESTAARYHTLFATLRSAPDRTVGVGDGETFVMRGGKAVTDHWKKFPGLRVFGVAPLYLKAGKLEQFTYSAVSRTAMKHNNPLFVVVDEAKDFIDEWHREYNISAPIWSNVNNPSQRKDEDQYSVHYPPINTGLTGYVHADIIRSNDITSLSLEDCVEEAEAVGSPFIQVEVPVETDTVKMQTDLFRNGFRLYGYRPGTDHEEASILMGRLKQGTEVVSSFWDFEQVSNPFWSGKIGRLVTQISESW